MAEQDKSDELTEAAKRLAESKKALDDWDKAAGEELDKSN